MESAAYSQTVSSNNGTEEREAGLPRGSLCFRKAETHTREPTQGEDWT